MLSISGFSVPKDSNAKRDFLADAMREMDFGGKPWQSVTQVRRIPNVIRVIMRPESRPRRRHHHGHRHRHIKGLPPILKFAEDLKKLTTSDKGTRKKTDHLFKTEETLKETLHFLEKVNSQLENMSEPHKGKNSTDMQAQESNITLRGEEEVMVTDSLPLFTELRSIVEHGKPFDPDATRAAFARAKQIVMDSVGEYNSAEDVGHLNNTKLTNAVALLEMAVREAEKMERNQTKAVNLGSHVNTTIMKESTQSNVNGKQSKSDALQLKVLKELLLEEFQRVNDTKDKASVLVTDIPFQNLRENSQASFMQRPSSPTKSYFSNSGLSSQNQNPVIQTQALLENYTSFITNMLKAAHLRLVRNLTGDLTNAKSIDTSKITNSNTNAQLQRTQLKLPSRLDKNVAQSKQQEAGQRFQNTTVMQNQQQKQLQLTQHVPFLGNGSVQKPNRQMQEEKENFRFSNTSQEQHQQLRKPFVSKERLAARKAFGTARKLVKAMLARQALYNAEKMFFAKIRDMVNQAPQGSPAVGLGTDHKESTISSQPTATSRIQSPVIGPSGATAGDVSNPNEMSEAHKKFEEAAHIEEKVAAQQEKLYDALMGHNLDRDDGGFSEDDATRVNSDDDGEGESEDYGDYKDSDEEAERRFYHDHRQGDFEAPTDEGNSFSLRDRISSVKEYNGNATTQHQNEISGSGEPRNRKDKLLKKEVSSWYGSSGDDSAEHNRADVLLLSKTDRNARSQLRGKNPKAANSHNFRKLGTEAKHNSFGFALKKSRFKNVTARRKTRIPRLHVHVL